MTGRALVAVVAVLAGCASGLFEDVEPTDAAIDSGALTDARVIDAPVIDAPVTDARIVDAAVDAGGVLQRLGHVVQLGETSSHAPDFLLGERVVVPQTFTLRQFGVIMISGGPQLQMALYTEAGGAPGTLVAQTAITATTAGTMELAPTVPNLVLAPGNYWLMGIVNVTASIGYTTAAASNTVHYIALPFGSPLPTTFGTPQTYTGQSFNYWIVVQ